MLLGNWTEAMRSAEQVCSCYINMIKKQISYLTLMALNLISIIFFVIPTGTYDGQKVFKSIHHQSRSLVSNLSIRACTSDISSWTGIKTFSQMNYL